MGDVCSDSVSFRNFSGRRPTGPLSFCHTAKRRIDRKDSNEGNGDTAFPTPLSNRITLLGTQKEWLDPSLLTSFVRCQHVGRQ